MTETKDIERFREVWNSPTLREAREIRLDDTLPPHTISFRDGVVFVGSPLSPYGRSVMEDEIPRQVEPNRDAARRLDEMAVEQQIVHMLNEWRLTHVALPDEIRVAPDVWSEIEAALFARHSFRSGERRVSVDGVPVVCDRAAPRGVVYTYCNLAAWDPSHREIL